MSDDNMDSSVIGEMVAEYKKLKEERMCLKVKLEKYRDQLSKAAKEVTDILAYEDWNLSDGSRLEPYPERSECLGSLTKYIDAQKKMDELESKFKSLGINIS